MRTGTLLWYSANRNHGVGVEWELLWLDPLVHKVKTPGRLRTGGCWGVLLRWEGGRHTRLGEGSRASGAGVAAGPHCFFSLIIGKGRTGVAVRGLGSSPPLGTSSVTLISVWSSSNIGSIIWRLNEETTVRLPAKLGNKGGRGQLSVL